MNTIYPSARRVPGITTTMATIQSRQATRLTAPAIRYVMCVCVYVCVFVLPLAPNGRSFSHKEQTQPVGVVIVVVGVIVADVVSVVAVVGRKKAARNLSTAV